MKCVNQTYRVTYLYHPRDLMLSNSTIHMYLPAWSFPWCVSYPYLSYLYSTRCESHLFMKCLNSQLSVVYKSTIYKIPSIINVIKSAIHEVHSQFPWWSVIQFYIKYLYSHALHCLYVAKDVT